MSRMRNGESDVNLADLPVLPPGWCWTTLSTIADIDGGITKDQKREQTISMREVPYLRVANVQRGYFDLQEIKSILADTEEIEKLRLQQGDVLFTEGGDRDKLGRGWVWSGEIEECIHQNHIFRARPCLPLVEPKFISFHGNFFGQQWFTSTGKQTTNLASINKGVLSRFPVPLAPLNEQQRIVAKIEELFSNLDAGVAALERVRTALKRYRASVLKAAVEGRLTEEWRAKHPATEPAPALLQRILHERRRRWEEDQLARFAAADREPPKGWQSKYIEPTGSDVTELPVVPEGWCWASVDQLAEVGTGTTPSRLVAAYYQDGTIPWIMSSAVNQLWVTEGSEHVTEKAIQETTLRLYPRYTLIIALYGEGKTRGKVSELAIEATINQALAALVTEGTASGCRQYLKVFLLSNYDRLRRQSAGGMQPNLNLGLVKKVVVPLPPADEQSQIVAEADQRLSVVDKVEAQVEANLKRAARLRQSILKRAFEGKLVPQVATDEPASVLLERIRHQRGQVAATVTEAEEGKPSKRRKESNTVFFRRGAVVTYIVRRLSDDPSFGRTKLEKILHLTQTHLCYSLDMEFKRHAAGPFDEIIFKLEAVAKKQGWFQTQNRPRFGVTYHPGQKADDLCQRASDYLGDKRAALDQLLDHFATLNTDEAELLATIYAAWNDLLIDGRPAAEDGIIAEVYGWHESKKRFTRSQILNRIAWMRQHDYVPTGQGQRTKVVEKKAKPATRRGRKPG